MASGANRSKDVAKKMFTEAGLERLRDPTRAVSSTATASFLASC
jgi:hypothetical protein